MAATKMTKVALESRVLELEKLLEDKPQPQHKDELKAWAIIGVVLMSVLSALLNGYANAQHATVAWAGWGMGLAIPAIILVLGKVASLLATRDHHILAISTAATGIGLLFLSVWHCSTSISLLTGQNAWLAMPQAIAIDCGFVCCELSLVAHLLPKRNKQS